MLENPFQKNARILFELEVLDLVRAFRQLKTDDTEAGGILLGYRRTPHIHITEATAPFRGDRRSRFEFDRRDRHHAAHALRRWKSSRGLVDCVGEWHTHPQVDPQPSAQDTAEWRRILSPLASPRVFMIVGTTSEWFGVGLRSRVRVAPVAE